MLLSPQLPKNGKETSPMSEESKQFEFDSRSPHKELLNDGNLKR